MKHVVFPLSIILILLSPDNTATAQGIHPQWSVANDSIVFYNRVENVADLFIMDPDTGDTQPLLSDGYYNANPSWSPDAKKLAFTSARPDMRGAWQLYILDVATLESKALTDDDDRKMHAGWSPDGKWISFVRMADGNSDVFIISTDGQTERQLTFSSDREFHPKWTADSRRVLFDSGPDGARTICSVDRHGGEPTCIEPDEGWHYSTPAASPDGSLIAYSCRDSDGGNICLMSPDGSGQRMLVDMAPGTDAGAPMFSPDGARIAYHQNADGDYTIVIETLD